MNSVLLLALLLTPEAPLIQDPIPETPDPQYQVCVKRVYNNIEKGRESAMQWVIDGGGPPAQHCLAVADLAAGHPKLAAIRLEELAQRHDAGDELVRARILSQAALAWVEAKEPADAERTINAAFDLAPDAPELYLVAANVYAAADKQQATIDAVTTAEEKGEVSSEGFVLRGRALHSLRRHREAADDVIAALSLDPMNVDALVLRGDLARVGIDIDAYYTDAGGD